MTDGIVTKSTFDPALDPYALQKSDGPQRYDPGPFDFHSHQIDLGTPTQVSDPHRYAPAIPDKVKVGHFVFTVCVDKSKLHDQERKGRRELYGACNFDKLEIVLDPVLPLHLMRDTLWHEIVHALFWLVGFEGKKTEEEYTRSGASLQLTALRDNPILVAYLMGP